MKDKSDASRRSSPKKQRPTPPDGEEQRDLSATESGDEQSAVTQSRRTFLGKVTAAAAADFNAIPLGCVPCSSAFGGFESMALVEPTRDETFYQEESSVPTTTADYSTASQTAQTENSGATLTASEETALQTAAANDKATQVPQEEASRLSSTGVLAAAGSQRRLVNPQSGVAYDLEGVDSHQLAANSAPAFASADEAAEQVELYWMSLARDVAFINYPSNGTIGSAVTDLNTRYKWYAGLPQNEIVPSGVTPRLQPRGFPTSPMTPLGQVPGSTNNITRGTVFRGFTRGDLTGPYLSQRLAHTPGLPGRSRDAGRRLRDHPQGVLQRPGRHPDPGLPDGRQRQPRLLHGGGL